MDPNHRDYEPFDEHLSSNLMGKHGAHEMLTLPDNHSSNTIVEPGPKEPASWTLELTTLALSVLFFVTKVATLVWVMDQPYYQIWKAPLSLNAILAILTTASKASQLHSVGEAIGQLKWVDFKTAPCRLRQFELYDGTSRGPQGAIKFILKGRWGLATVGAFIIIFALAVDPFTQQVVELRAQNVTTPDDKAIFGFARGYDTNPTTMAFDTISNPSISSRDPGIQGAILRGIYNIKSPDEFQCGGACRWNETYTSLGVSSSCRDIKEIAEALKVCTGPGTGFCNYTTPNNVHFMTEYVATASATALIVAVNDTFSQLMETPDHVLPDFLHVAIFQSNSGERSDFNDPGVLADNITECTLSFSLHEYSNITANGSQLHFAHETTKLEPGRYLRPDGPVSYSSSSLWNVTFNQSESGPINTPFYINARDWSSMVQFFKSNSFVSHIIAGEAIQGKDTDRVGTGGAFINADVPAVFAALARSMTDYLRSITGGPNAEPAYGARVESVVYVRIRWRWLALPLIEELAALIFVIWVIIHNKRHHIPAWKSSILAVLGHNLNQDSLLVTTFSGPKAVDEHAQKLYAQLE
ncbi:hypothetical protein F4680DRAFT_454895 [Xylaria scruposa]|nr:hypothetical protein F4680DRAFT_454895 [Xylaria scruposa]